MPGTLFLIPNLLGDASLQASLPAEVIGLVQRLQHFVVEDEKSARKFLKLCGVMPPYDHIRMYVLDKHTSYDERMSILSQLQDKEAGILSDAGCPAVADPGADLVRQAHEKNITIRPLVGPSSILLGLMASGFNGQAFSFHGYLPVTSLERIQKLRELENVAMQTSYTQIFIETPFRNEALLQDIIKTGKDNTYLSVAADITLPSEEIHTYTIANWRKKTVNLRNRPAVFLLWSSAAKFNNKKEKYGKNRDH
jgi:16S rRNA (cytidine1402-2'-O)-methyltransferase